MALLSLQQRKQLVLKNMPLANKFASRYYRHFQYRDIHQASFLGLCEAAEDWDPDKGSSFSSWAYNLMRNRVKQELNSAGEVPLVEDTIEAEAAIDSDSESAALLELMHKLVYELPEDQRHVVLLKYPLDQHSPSYNDKQIARMLDVSATWVRVLRKRAFTNLRGKIERLKIR